MGESRWANGHILANMDERMMIDEGDLNGRVHDGHRGHSTYLSVFESSELPFWIL